MLRKRHLLSLFVVCCLFIVFAGCQNKDGADESPEGAAKTDTNASPQNEANAASQQLPPDPFEIKPPAGPTEAELSALGPIREENRELLRFMSDNPSCFTVIHPARAIQAPYLAEYYDVAEIIISQFFTGFNQYFPANQQIPFSNMKRISFCASPMKQKPSIDPMTGQMMQQSPNEIPTVVCILELNEPVDDLVLLSLFNPFGQVVTETLTPVTVGGMKAYDMVPPTVDNPLMERMVFVNPTTVVFASGNASEVTKVFDSEPSQGAIPSRVLRTDMQNGDLIALYSTEGITFGFGDMLTPYFIAKSALMQFQGQQLNVFMEQENAFNFARKLKNMTVRLNLTSPESGNILQADMELLSQADVEPLKKSIETPVADLTNAMSLQMAKNQSADMSNLPVEQQEALREVLKTGSFLISTLDELKVTASGTKLQLALKKAAGFDTAFQDILAPIFIQVRVAKAAQLDRDQMRGISRGVGGYLQGNNDRYPHFAVFSENGTPLLSWRVAILPYLGELELYNRFHLNEPWDSEHNRALIAMMPKVYADPSGLTPAGKTLYRMIGGQGSFLSRFPNGFSVSDLKFPQGTLYMVTVRPEQAVEWTRPEYVQYDPNTFGQVVKDIFAAMFCTGEVDLYPVKEIMAGDELAYWVSGEMSPQVAQQMIARQNAQMIQQQMQQSQAGPGMTTQPLPNNSMGTGVQQTQPPMQNPPMSIPPQQMPQQPPMQVPPMQP